MADEKTSPRLTGTEKIVLIAMIAFVIAMSSKNAVKS